MRKVIMFLMASLICCGSGFAQQTSHWPDFNLYDYEQHGSIVAVVQIDNEIVGPDDNWAQMEVAAFVNDTIRGYDTLVYQPWYGDQYPIVELEIYYNHTDEAVSFKLFDRVSGHEYDICTGSINPSTGENYLTGEDYRDYDNLMVLSFSTPAFTKTILGYTQGSKDRYYLIASPIGEVNPGDVLNMTSNNFDLFSFDQNANDGREWINMKGGSQNLVSGAGYLYANSETIDLTFTGFAYEGCGEVTLAKNNDANPGCDFEGWNLVGNPFAQTAYIDRPFYTMNDDGSEIVLGAGNTVGPMEGLFVIAETDGETMTFSTEESAKTMSQMVLNVIRNGGSSALRQAQGPAVVDRAIICFDETNDLPKFQLNSNNTKLYLPKNGKSYAVVNAGRDVPWRVSTTEIPVNFKASENGTYTLSFTAEGVIASEAKQSTLSTLFSYLHLIDNKTGADIDLLHSNAIAGEEPVFAGRNPQFPTYTFTATTTDPASRFRLVFSAVDGPSTD